MNVSVQRIIYGQGTVLIQERNNIMSDVGVYAFLGLAVLFIIVLVITFIIDYRKWLRY